MRQLSLVILVSFFSGSAFAYSSSGGPTFGLMGLYSNYTQTSSTLVQGTTNSTLTISSGPGYGGGLVGNFPLGSGFLSLEARALYVVEGDSASVSGTISGMTVTGSLTSTAPYIEIPLLLNFNLASVFALHAGGYYAIATGNTNTTSNLVVSGVPVNTTSSSTNSTNDYGLDGGFEITLNPSSSTKFFISGDYLYGLANFNSGTTGASSTSARIIQASAGILFPL